MNRLIIGAMPAVPKPLIGRVARRYIAGDSIADAADTVRRLNVEGAMATVDLLGEDCRSESNAREAAMVYHNLLAVIDQRGLDSHVSLKPTHLGLKLDFELCSGLIEGIVVRAAELNNFVRIDMEDHTCTDDTLKIHHRLREKYGNVGVVIQAYLRRTIDDITQLIDLKANLRLCKGIYNETRAIAYKNQKIIIDNYAFLLEELLKGGCYVGIATHCEETIWHALRIIRKLNLSPDRYEFQMLLGVDPELRSILISAGHRLRVYVPFGQDWYPYSKRRLKENPRIAGHVMKDFLWTSSRDGRS